MRMYFMKKIIIGAMLATFGIAVAGPVYKYQKPLNGLDININCTAPWGAAILDGASITAYRDATASIGACTSETRRCTDGILSGSYSNSSCNEIGFQGCTTPWGSTLNSGQSAIAYEFGAVPYGSSCGSETRTCNNGALSGSFTYSGCTVALPVACTSPWGATIISGNSIIAYKNASVPFGSVCEAQQRDCLNGNLSGSYGYEACSVQTGASCTLNDGTVLAHGETAARYTAVSVPTVESCSSYQTTVSCSNGTATPSPTYATCNNDGVAAMSYLAHFDGSPNPTTGTSPLTITGASYPTSAKFGSQAISFSGLNSSTGMYIPSSAPETSFGTGDFTIEFWMKPKTPTGSSIALTLGNYAGSGGMVGVRATSGAGGTTNLMLINASANNTSVTTYGSNVNISNNVWHHLAMVRQSGTISMYVDGVKKSTAIGLNTAYLGHVVIGNGDMYDTSMKLSDAYGWSVDIDELMIAKSAVYTGSSFSLRTMPY